MKIYFNKVDISKCNINVFICHNLLTMSHHSNTFFSLNLTSNKNNKSIIWLVIPFAILNIQIVVVNYIFFWAVFKCFVVNYLIDSWNDCVEIFFYSYHKSKVCFIFWLIICIIGELYKIPKINAYLLEILIFFKHHFPQGLQLF